jgi:NAD(P)-dependent dehydrogenase (short-subunit alcohol dehydrogenase family)
MNLADASVVVAGGASGLGLATARLLSERAGFVVVADVDDGGREQVESLGTHVRFVRTDVSRSDEVAAAVAVAAETAPLRVAVATAGVNGRGRVLGVRGPMDVGYFERVVGVNLIGTAALLVLAAERMAHNEPLEGERGVVVTTSSIAAYDGGNIAYAASKAGVAGLTLSAAHGLAPHAVRVVCVAPGIFRTPMYERGAAATIHDMVAAIPFPSRLGEPEEFARFVAAVVDTPLLNGEVVRLDAALRLPRLEPARGPSDPQLP